MHAHWRLNNGKTGALVPAVVIGGILLVVGAFLVLAIVTLRRRDGTPRTEGLIRKIAIGVNAYHLYFPREYPEFGASPDDTRKLREVLTSSLEVRISYSDPNQRTHKVDPLVEFRTDEVDGTGNIVDQWGQCIFYCRGRQHTDKLNPPAGMDCRAGFDLWSIGPPKEKGKP